MGGSVIDAQGQGSVLIEVASLVKGSSSNAGDLSEVGINHDDTVLVDLNQTTLSAQDVDGIGGLDSKGSLVLHTVDVGGVGGLRGQTEVGRNIALLNGSGIGLDGGSLNGGVEGILGVLLITSDVVVLTVPGVIGTAPSIVLISGLGQAEVLVAEGGVLGAADEGAHVAVAERRGVSYGRDLSSSAEQELGNQLTGSGSVEVHALDILQNAELLGGLSDVELPISAGELIVLVVADSAQDHGESLIAGDLVGGTEGLGVIALDQAGVRAVADVTGCPGSAVHVAELVVGGVQRGLLVGHVRGVQTINDSRDLSAGDVALGLEGIGAVGVLVAVEHTHAGQHVNSLGIGLVDVLRILKSGVGTDDGQRQSHDQRQHQCE